MWVVCRIWACPN